MAGWRGVRRAEERQPPLLRNTIQQIRAATAQQGARGVETFNLVARATNDAFIVEKRRRVQQKRSDEVRGRCEPRDGTSIHFKVHIEGEIASMLRWHWRPPARRRANTNGLPLLNS